jgi:uncharacterized 2Fe-2S/4Fe-4S cluster protein (DUF4445 family)
VGDLIHAGRHQPLVPGRTLFEQTDELATVVPASCRFSGRCRECVVGVNAGADSLSPPTEAEAFLKPPYRLACQARVERADTDVEIAVLRRRLQIVTSSTGAEQAFDPLVRRHGDEVRSDGERIDTYRGGLYGIALDLGTTTVVFELVDLEAGTTLETVALENPQRVGGSDVISRIAYDGGPYHGELRNAVRRALNHELRRIYVERGIPRQAVCEVVVVGNATMRDLFFGLDVAPIGVRPFRSLTETEYREGRRETTAISAAAHEVGLLVNPRARVYGGPLIGCHVGADIAADLLAVDFEALETPAMLVDVGTNSEVVIAHDGRYVAASSPAGPAFEGGLVRHGMQAAEGAIQAVTADDGTVAWHTIGDTEPVGICGSGLVDALAVVRRLGWMDRDGRFGGGARELPIAPEHGIVLTRADAAELAQAKAANASGQALLLERLGLVPGDLRGVYLAGGFAQYIDVANAVDIGFLVPAPAQRIHKVGNASLRGARAMLLSARRRAELDRFVRRIEHVELEQMPSFFDRFVDGCRFTPIAV